MGIIRRFFGFTGKLAKILKLYSKFRRITFKNVNMLLKNSDFYDT